MVNFEKDEPWLIIKKDIKLNLRSYDFEEWQDNGDDPSWGQARLLGDDWEADSKGAHCVKLKWNKLGWTPAHLELTLLLMSREERDELLSFMVRSIFPDCIMSLACEGV